MKYFIQLCLLFVICEADSDIPVPNAPANSSKLKGNHTFIVGGTDAVSGEVPWIVTLGLPNFLCGGSIVNARTIVTAAHCVDGKTASGLKIRVGSLSMTKDGLELGVSRVTVHPFYNSFIHDNDLAVLQLTSDIPLDGKTMAPVSMPVPNSDPSDGQTVLVAGWGTTQSGGSLPGKLMKVNVNIVSRSKCQKDYGFTPITDKMICAGVEEGGKDSCQGDSGGPLTDGNALVGIVSWGFGCADKLYPGVYTRVSKYVDWINKVKAQIKA